MGAREQGTNKLMVYSWEINRLPLQTGDLICTTVWRLRQPERPVLALRWEDPARGCRSHRHLRRSRHDYTWLQKKDADSLTKFLQHLNGREDLEEVIFIGDR